MLFGLLKRKFHAIEEYDQDALSTSSTDSAEACSPRKRMQVEEPASIHEINLKASQTVFPGGHEEVKKQKEEGMENFRTKLKEWDKTSMRIKKEAEINKMLAEEVMMCPMCHDSIQNPQSSICGNTVCSSCLRSRWTQPLARNDSAEMIDTKTESDLDEEDTPLDATASVPKPRRHMFPSALRDRKKFCTYCNEDVTLTPEFPIPAAAETLNSNISPLPPHVRTRREARSTRRKDMAS